MPTSEKLIRRFAKKCEAFTETSTLGFTTIGLLDKEAPHVRRFYNQGDFGMRGRKGRKSAPDKHTAYKCPLKKKNV